MIWTWMICWKMSSSLRWEFHHFPTSCRYWTTGYGPLLLCKAIVAHNLLVGWRVCGVLICYSLLFRPSCGTPYLFVGSDFVFILRWCSRWRLRHCVVVNSHQCKAHFWSCLVIQRCVTCRSFVMRGASNVTFVRRGPVNVLGITRNDQQALQLFSPYFSG